ncbi:hypothetical protein HG536_0G04190 [Torulaspora globosa]|uniref:Uncharacterized protein n=1 Tax=Torulaspora globosa TaxID=48254 RepID=A0A7G3ZM21_9SACH|nr:uncharacterized protein HG536_0G04190 [Torulaspora globosa]QLL34557.1 hypothetical protein HG536_0G04190 [Torulaspora globosa]
MEPPVTVVSFVINVASLIVVSYGLYTCTGVELPPSLKDAGHKQFLTNLCATFTILNDLCNIANFVAQSSGSPVHSLSFVARHVTLPLAMGVESVVAAVYWPLRLFAMHLIFTSSADNDRCPIPLPSDLAIHLAPITFLLCDHYLSGAGTKFRISNRVASSIVLALGFGYKAYLDRLIDKDAGQAFPYPFLDVEEPKRSIIAGLVTSLFMLFYLLYQSKPPKSVRLPGKID